MLPRASFECAATYCSGRLEQTRLKAAVRVPCGLRRKKQLSQSARWSPSGRPQAMAKAAKASATSLQQPVLRQRVALRPAILRASPGAVTCGSALSRSRPWMKRCVGAAFSPHLQWVVTGSSARYLSELPPRRSRSLPLPAYIPAPAAPGRSSVYTTPQYRPHFHPTPPNS